MIEFPLPVGIAILLIISIVITRIWREIANLIGRRVRSFFVNLWEAIKVIKND